MYLALRGLNAIAVGKRLSCSRKLTAGEGSVTAHRMTVEQRQNSPAGRFAIAPEFVRKWRRSGDNKLADCGPAVERKVAAEVERRRSARIPFSLTGEFSDKGSLRW